MTRPTLRPYQTRALDLLRDSIASGKRRPILVLATGSGKTIIAAEIMSRAVDRGLRVLFVAPRRELVYQARDKLATFGVYAGLIMAGEDMAPYHDVQIGSVDTLVSRLFRRKNGNEPPPIIKPQMVIYDEAHLYVTKRRQALLDLWGNVIRIGLTATPSRKDGRALGLIADDLVEPTTIAKLTKQKYLAPARYYSVSEPDLERVRTVAGDWHQGELEDACAPLVGDIVTTWLERAGGRRTIVFGISIAHAARLAREFCEAGVAAEHVHAKTMLTERAGIMERYLSGQTQVLCNCFLASYGFDAPETSCIVLARPTKSLVLYLQMLGRGLRPAGDFPDCLVLDHSGAVHYHGLAEDQREWTLEGETAIVDSPKRPGERSEGKLYSCDECGCVYSGRPDCPECGYVRPRLGVEVQTLDGELVELEPGALPDDVDRVRLYGELLGIAASRGYKSGWVAHAFKKRAGSWPPFSWKNRPPVDPLQPSPDLLREVQAEVRRYWREKNRAAPNAQAGDAVSEAMAAKRQVR